MEIIGEITNIVYQNEINSYTVAEFETENEEITVVGYLPFISVGDTLKLTGKIIMHQDYGEQFKVDTFEKLPPKTLSSLEKYLANGTIKGIGPATAKKIISTFGEETLHVLKFEPEKLAQIKGINEEKARSISETFVENLELWQIVGYLDKFGIGVQNAKNIYKELGVDAIEEIEKNPYILIDIVNNVDFKKIDKMAMEIGISYNYEKRVKAGIKYAIMNASINGHCKVQRENLYTFLRELLNVSTEDIEDNIIELKVQNQIVEEDEWIYLTPFYDAEKNIAERLQILQLSENIKKIKNIAKDLKEIEKHSDIELSKNQLEAVEIINKNNVCIITGGPGTGKTTIIKTIIELYEKRGKKVVLCAPTGRAAKRMTEATGQDAKTLHRLLEIGKLEEDTYKNVNNEVSMLDADVVIVDEMSMVDLFLMNHLVKALYQGTKLILVGDADQLPSVGPGSVLKDLINSERIPTIVLNEIFRQAAKSKIVLNSHRVNNGENFLRKEDVENDQLEQDFFYINESKQEKILEQVISLSCGRLKDYEGYDFFKNIQIITPTKKGMLGTKELNRTLQSYLNPRQEGLLEKQFGDTIYRENDRIMQIKNNYDILWEKEVDEYEEGTGVFNGELGIIEKIDEEEKNIKIRFDDGKIAWYQYSDLDQIEHSYAITIHKAQRK